MNIPMLAVRFVSKKGGPEDLTIPRSPNRLTGRSPYLFSNVQLNVDPSMVAETVKVVPTIE